MGAYNASNDQRKSQQWRNELTMEPSEQTPLNATAFFKEFQQKYVQAQQAQAGLHEQHSQYGQHGQHGQNGRNIQSGQHGQPFLRPGQPGQTGQPGQSGQPSQPSHQVLAGATVCCDQANCDKTKIEQIFPEQYMHEPATPFTLMPPSDSPQAGTKEATASDFGMYCPCGLNRGQLVTICCTGRDCDESTKIDDIQMGPPEEKRAKTTYNQFKY